MTKLQSKTETLKHLGSRAGGSRLRAEGAHSLRGCQNSELVGFSKLTVLGV